MKLFAQAIKELIALGVKGDRLVEAIDRLEAAAHAGATSLPDAVEKSAETEAAKLPTYDRAETRRRLDRERKRKKAETAAEIPPESGAETPSASRTQVVTLTSSLRSEGTQEANASFVDAPSAEPIPAEPKKPPTKPPKSQRGTRLPEDWEPSADEFDLGRQAGLTDEEIHRAALEFRNYWCSRSRDAAKLSWRLTWHNRVIELGERKRRSRERLASAPGEPGGKRRGATSFADIYARRHGLAAE